MEFIEYMEEEVVVPSVSDEGNIENHPIIPTLSLNNDNIMNIDNTINNPPISGHVPDISQQKSISATSTYKSSDPDITFKVYTNDGSDESSIALITLKNIFSRQLPKMPKEYIVRLVLDKRHYSMAILRKGRIIGGICYRPYTEQRFGEIAFCAINGTEQVKGYGTILMNHLKDHVQYDKMEYFLTYADNYAIGYFQKQGFTKHVSMPKERWVGFIKDYDGGTLMECYIHPNMDYLHTRELVASQRRFILARIQERSQQHLVYGAGDMFSEGRRLLSALDAPGFQQAGWNNSVLFRGNTERDRHIAMRRLSGQLTIILEKIKSNTHSWPFEMAVDVSMCTDYRDLIKNPIDLQLITQRLDSGTYYRTKEMMAADLLLMVNNCKEYNGAGTELYAAAESIERLVLDLFKDAAVAKEALASSENKDES